MLGLMVCPYSLDLALATSGQFSGTFDSMARSTQGNNTLMGGGVRDTARVLASNLGELNALALSLRPYTTSSMKPRSTCRSR